MPKLIKGDKLHGSFDYSIDHEMFVGVVARIRGKEMMACAVGMESTDVEIMDWIRRTVELMRAAGHTDVQADDVVDRARIAQQVMTQH